MPVIAKITKHSCNQNKDDTDNTEYEKIDIRFVDGTSITITTEPDCCASSWLEEYQGTTFESCIGKDLVKVFDTCEEEESVPASGVQDVDTNHISELQFADGTSFRFLSRCSHNGYYGANLIVLNECNLKTKKEYPEESLVFVVGLPGSGKTTFAKQLQTKFKWEKSVLNDDCFDWIENQRNADEVDVDIFTTSMETDVFQNGQKVILCHPLLCKESVYKSIVELLRVGNPEKAIVTYCFDKNVDQSIRNLAERENNPNRLKSLIDDVYRLSSNYNPDSSQYFNKIPLITYTK